jgi:hypothetical protein
MAVDATLKVDSKDPHVQCTRKERGLKPGQALVHVVGDEMVELTVRGTTPNERVPFEYLYKVNMDALRAGAQEVQVEKRIVAAALRDKLKGQDGGRPPAENLADLIAPKYIAKVRVPK